MRITIKIDGEKEVKEALKRLGKDAMPKIGQGLYEVCELIMTQSKEQCPVDTGTLRRTGNVGLPKIGLRNVEVEMGYGGPAAPYAIYVHEDLTKNHPVGKAKFLEDPLNAAVPIVPVILAAKLRR